MEVLKVHSQVIIYIYIGNNQPALGSTGRLKRIETFHRFESNQNWLVVEPPLWKIWKSMGMIIPYIMENKNVWSHQPEKKNIYMFNMFNTI